MRPTARTRLAIGLALWAGVAAWSVLGASGGAAGGGGPGGRGGGAAGGAAGAGAGAGAGGAGEKAAVLVRYPSRYYDLYTDLGPEVAQEAALRMTAMAEEYAARTGSADRPIRERLPFYLFSARRDYEAAGGLPGSGGVFTGDKLMAVAGRRPDARTWHIVQHEGFHQFADRRLGPLPAWVNEGLAEYFGESIFTGDGFVSGVAPPWRVKRVQALAAAGGLRPLSRFLEVSYKDWNGNLQQANYDQSWALTQFLVHGDDDRYQQGFSRYVNAVAAGRPAARAFNEHLGAPDAVERRFLAWLKGLPARPTAERSARAAVATLTSFLSRAHRAGQRFDSFADFARALKDGTIKAPPGEALPSSLADFATATLAGEERDATVRLTGGGGAGGGGEAAAGGLPRVEMVRNDRLRLIGRFTTAGANGTAAGRVWVETDDLAVASDQAATLHAAGKTAEARALLTDALKRNPASPEVAAARRLMGELARPASRPAANR